MGHCVGAGTNNTHPALQDINKLWQFI